MLTYLRASPLLGHTYEGRAKTLGIDKRRESVIYFTSIPVQAPGEVRFRSSGLLVRQHEGLVVRTLAAPGHCQAQVPFCFGSWGRQR